MFPDMFHQCAAVFFLTLPPKFVQPVFKQERAVRVFLRQYAAVSYMDKLPCVVVFKKPGKARCP